jgi:hypothetical protein
MQHSALVAFLDGDVSPEAFHREISNEVDACEREFQAEGLGHVIVTGGPVRLVTRDHARRLLEALRSGRLPVRAATYAADCLMMSDNFVFDDAAVIDAISFVADESRPPTSDEIAAALTALG